MSGSDSEFLGIVLESIRPLCHELLAGTDQICGDVCFYYTAPLRSRLAINVNTASRERRLLLSSGLEAFPFVLA